MRKEAYSKVKEEMKRMQAAIKAYDAKAAEDKYAFFGCKESGAVKRASMDLTRALTELRRS